jgi:hypothetical protein
LRHFLFILCLVLANCSFCQTSTDTLAKPVKKTSKHSPKAATILSAVIPGAGQIYNRKYWKLPIIYSGLGGLGYVFLNAQQNYSYYQRNLKHEADADPATINESGFGITELQSEKIRFRKQRDLLGFGLIAIYALNIIDANVDAHLKTFDVSDDLSLIIKAKPIYTAASAGGVITAGLNISLRWK